MQPYSGNYTPTINTNYEISYAPEGVDLPIYSQLYTPPNELAARAVPHFKFITSISALAFNT